MDKWCETLTVVKERVLEGNKMRVVLNRPKDWQEALDRLGNLHSIYDGLIKDDLITEKVIGILINGFYSVATTTKTFYALKELHDELLDYKTSSKRRTELR